MINAATSEPTPAKRKKKGSCGITWTTKEDECMVESWKTVTKSPITGANQTCTAYWTRIKTEFDERRFTKKYYLVHMDRNQGAIEHRWRIIRRVVNQFHGCLENIRDQPKVGRTSWIK